MEPTILKVGDACLLWSVCAAPDGCHAVAGCINKTIRVVSLPSGNALRTLEGHTGAVCSVCVSPDSKHIVSGSSDKTVRIWLLADGSAVRTLKGHTGRVRS
eukprot:6955355-Prymnesium_polylepis.1